MNLLGAISHVLFFRFSTSLCSKREARTLQRTFRTEISWCGGKMVCRACGYRMLSGPLADGPFLQLFMMKRVKHSCGSFVHLASSEKKSWNTGKLIATTDPGIRVWYGMVVYQKDCKTCEGSPLSALQAYIYIYNQIISLLCSYYFPSCSLLFPYLFPSVSIIYLLFPSSHMPPRFPKR